MATAKFNSDAFQQLRIQRPICHSHGLAQRLQSHFSSWPVLRWLLLRMACGQDRSSLGSGCWSDTMYWWDYWTVAFNCKGCFPRQQVDTRSWPWRLPYDRSLILLRGRLTEVGLYTPSLTNSQRHHQLLSEELQPRELTWA